MLVQRHVVSIQSTPSHSPAGSAWVVAPDLKACWWTDAWNLAGLQFGSLHQTFPIEQQALILTESRETLCTLSCELYNTASTLQPVLLSLQVDFPLSARAATLVLFKSTGHTR